MGRVQGLVRPLARHPGERFRPRACSPFRLPALLYGKALQGTGTRSCEKLNETLNETLETPSLYPFPQNLGKG